MAYNAPDGYVFDKNTGLYYTQVIAEDKAGNKSQVVTWFNPDSGEYKQEVYPIEGKTSKSSSRYIICGVAALIVLLTIGIVVFIRIGNSDKKANKLDLATDIVDNTADASGITEKKDLEMLNQNNPEPEQEPKEMVEEMHETESDTEVESIQTESGLPNCYGIDEDELLRCNMMVMEMTMGNSYCNGEMCEWFSFPEIGEDGITQVFYHTEPLNNNQDITEYYIDVTPMGARFSSQYGLDCIETKVRGAGLEITFYVFIDGTGVDAQNVVVDDTEYSQYKHLNFGMEYPGEYYLM